MREATEKLEKGSETRAQFEQISGKLEEAERRADFFEEASKPEVGCTNPRLAYLGAQEIGAFSSKGKVDWEAIKKNFPELFRTAQPRTAGNAGAGTGTTAPGAPNMDSMIRQAARRG